ncbi:unnamed protein product [Tetraodon nigroviridis]|uniref:(spotted green pufferfish) hypothetical protein n=1 Tax=Tetraodon nigroviridis TaxID=99883 RepID=Q4RW63_TETNG|nr:unnamed protein product [Tetraodon nigroviridis]
MTVAVSGMGGRGTGPGERAGLLPSGVPMSSSDWLVESQRLLMASWRARAGRDGLLLFSAVDCV